MAQEDNPGAVRSPLQSAWRGNGGRFRQWRAPTTQDFLRQLRRRLAVGPVYALAFEGWEDALIFVRTLDDDRWTEKWRYPVTGLRAMSECGFIEMKEETDMPGFDLDEFESRFRPAVNLAVWWLSMDAHESRA